jgi:long-chain acyl-CoA synthetase
MTWTLGDIIRRHARTRGDRPMITFAGRTITWSAMDARSSQVARGLLAAGLVAQDRVAVLDRNGPEYFEVLFGAAKASIVTVAVNWRLAPGEMAYTINDAAARALFVGPDFLGHLAGIERTLKTVETVVVLGEPRAPGQPGPAEAAAPSPHPRHEGYEAWIARHPADDPGGTPAPGDVAMQLYTSGTTGLPRGAMLTNASLGTLLPHVPGWWNVDETSVSLVCMPLFHIGGSGWALVGMGLGCHSILEREFVPAEILATLERHRVTNALFVPAMLHFLTSVPGAADRDYSALRSIVYGASPITDEVLLRAMRTFRCDFIQVYGLTETTGAITQLPAADHVPGGPRAGLLRSAGKPFPWVALRIVDPATEQDCSPGEIGEVWTRSVQNFKGYWNRPEETARTLLADGWLRTGDAGYLDSEGYLFLTDRVKDMIISGGENVYPAEVENVLAAHPAVADVAVIGVPDDRWGETVKAIVVPRPGAEPRPGDIIVFARERLAHYKCPTSVDYAETLPRNPSGKLLKRELREPYWRGRERRIN